MGDILMYASISPPDSVGVSVDCFPRLNTTNSRHLPFSISHVLDSHRIGHESVTFVLMAAPATYVMGAGNHARLNGFRDPNLIHKPADFSCDFKKITIPYT